MWIARDTDGPLKLFLRRPFRSPFENGCWVCDGNRDWMVIDKNLCPNWQWEHGALEVDIKEYLNQKCGLLQEIKEYFNSTPKDELQQEWENIKHLNQIGPDVEEYYNSADMTTQEQPKDNEDCLALLQKLPRLNNQYDVVENGDYIPTLYFTDGLWFISWMHFDDAEIILEYKAETIEEVVKIAFTETVIHTVKWMCDMNGLKSNKVQ